MAARLLPRIGSWYRTAGGDAFEVVAQDEQAETIEIEYQDGTLEELDVETWNEMERQRLAPRARWSGPEEDEPLGPRRSPRALGELDWSMLDGGYPSDDDYY